MLGWCVEWKTYGKNGKKIHKFLTYDRNEAENKASELRRKGYKGIDIRQSMF